LLRTPHLLLRTPLAWDISCSGPHLPLYRTPLTQDSSFSGHLLCKTPLTQDTSYSGHLLLRTPLAQDTSCLGHLAQDTSCLAQDTSCSEHSSQENLDTPSSPQTCPHFLIKGHSCIGGEGGGKGEGGEYNSGYICPNITLIMKALALYLHHNSIPENQRGYNTRSKVVQQVVG
jgi:hypothetical protein